MRGNNELQVINAAIWTATSMLLDDCEQVVGQLRAVRTLLERDSDSTRTGPAHRGAPAKRGRELSDVSNLPPLPRSTPQQSVLYSQAFQPVKRVKVLSPEDTARLDRSTPISRQRHHSAYFRREQDPFQSPAARRRPAVVISSESE